MWVVESQLTRPENTAMLPSAEVTPGPGRSQQGEGTGPWSPFGEVG